MSSIGNHVFAECAPVGLAGIGGHGHNDCLTFEAVLKGRRLVTDSGSLVYTASYEQRNAFRSTSFHNTPQIDGLEINRFVSPVELWTLRYEAVPTVHVWRTGPDYDVLVASHAGYHKLDEPVWPMRIWALHHGHSVLLIRDCFRGSLEHTGTVPVHLAPEVAVVGVSSGNIELEHSGDVFALQWLESEQWQAEPRPCRIAPSYGVAVDSTKVVFTSRTGSLSTLTVVLSPSGLDREVLWNWVDSVTTQVLMRLDELDADDLHRSRR